MWLKSIRDDVIVYYSSYFGWPWNIRSRSNWASKVSICYISVTIQDTDLWLTILKDDVIVYYSSYFRWPWETRPRSNWSWTSFGQNNSKPCTVWLCRPLTSIECVNKMKWWWLWVIRAYIYTHALSYQNSAESCWYSQRCLSVHEDNEMPLLPLPSQGCS